MAGCLAIIRTTLLLLMFAFLPVHSSASMQDADSQSTTDQKEQPAPAKPPSDDKSAQDSEDESKPSVQRIPRSEIDIKPPVALTEVNKADLTHYLPEQNIEPLLVGPDEHIMLIETNATENNKGVMILLPDWQQTATSPKAINFLRQKMPEQGWTTLSIQPPEKPANYPSNEQNNTKRMADNQKALADYSKALANIISAAIDKAKSYPGIIIMLTEGHHAALLFDIYQQDLSEAPSALISLSAFLEDDASNLHSAKQLAQIDLPVLDLYLRTDHKRIKHAAMQRKKQVNQELKSYFRQKELFNSRTGYYPQATLNKEITGWLKSQGW